MSKSQTHTLMREIRWSWNNDPETTDWWVSEIDLTAARAACRAVESGRVTASFAMRHALPLTRLLYTNSPPALYSAAWRRRTKLLEPLMRQALQQALAKA